MQDAAGLSQAPNGGYMHTLLDFFLLRGVIQQRERYNRCPYCPTSLAKYTCIPVRGLIDMHFASACTDSWQLPWLPRASRRPCLSCALAVLCIRAIAVGVLYTVQVVQPACGIGRMSCCTTTLPARKCPNAGLCWVPSSCLPCTIPTCICMSNHAKYGKMVSVQTSYVDT